jgi:hypothetical protein
MPRNKSKGIFKLTPERCYVYGKRNKKREGTIIGAVCNPYWHPYSYCAYHIEFDDGKQETHLAKEVIIPGDKDNIRLPLIPPEIDLK